MTPTQPANDNRPAEFDEQLVRYLPGLRALALRLRPSTPSDEREDLVNSTVLKALENWHKYRPGSSPFPWLSLLMRGIARDELDRAKALQSTGRSWCIERSAVLRQTKSMPPTFRWFCHAFRPIGLTTFWLSAWGHSIAKQRPSAVSASNEPGSASKQPGLGWQRLRMIPRRCGTPTLVVRWWLNALTIIIRIRYNTRRRYLPALFL